jgi:hypothetical protein
MHLIKTLVPVIGFAIAASALAGAATGANALFSESFDDADLTRRNWYDGTKFRIVGDSRAGRGFAATDSPAPAQATAKE